MSLHFMHGLDWRLMVPQVAAALSVASECFGEEGEDCLVSCLTRHIKGRSYTAEEDFAANGFHSTGRAFDLSVNRVRGSEPIPEEKLDRILVKLEVRLGRSDGGPFDVLDERHPRPDSPGWTGPHFHLEFQPQ